MYKEDWGILRVLGCRAVALPSTQQIVPVLCNLILETPYFEFVYKVQLCEEDCIMLRIGCDVGPCCPGQYFQLSSANTTQEVGEFLKDSFEHFRLYVRCTTTLKLNTMRFVLTNQSSELTWLS